MGVEHLRFTGPQNRERDLHELSGLIRGIALDGRIEPKELTALLRWCAEKRIQQRSVFNEAITRVESAVSDGVLDDEERADLLHFCERLGQLQDRTDVLTRDMQVLHGLMAGIAADGVITESELREFRTWLDDTEHLKGKWPYDEIDSLVTSAMSDQRIDAEEQRFLMAFTSQFLERDNQLLTEEQTEELVKHGICATQPVIEFTAKNFVITGESNRRSPDGGTYSREQMHDEIERRGGITNKNITKVINYLVVCDGGNPAWAFSCYGRKIEKVMNMRRGGARIVIVNERDFFDALEDVKPRPLAENSMVKNERKTRRRSHEHVVLVSIDVASAVRDSLEQLIAQAATEELRERYRVALKMMAE